MKNLQQHFYLIVFFHILFTGCGNYSSDEGSVDGKIKPIITSISPSEGETNVEVTTSISLQFSQGINTNSVTTNNSNTNCSGTVQISTDNFSSCIKMSSVVGSSDSNKTFTVKPESNLNGETNYHIRVTTEIIGDSGNNLSGQFTTSQGFTTKDITPPTVLTILPTDNASEVPVFDNISVTFSESMETSSVTTNTSDTSCSGSLMVSSDNFSSCVKMSSSPVVSNSNKTFTSSTSDNFSYSTTYKMRVSTGVKDTVENSMANTYETSSGFHTDTWSGTQQLGTSLQDYGNGVTVDSSDNIYVTGYTGDALDGNTSAGNVDTFLVKYNSSGTKQWTQQLGTSQVDYGQGVAVDSSDNIYVTGFTRGDLDGNTTAGLDDIFLVKYNSSGTKQWTQQLGTSSVDLSIAVKVDSSNNVYITGRTSGGLDGNITSGGYDLFLVKYNSSGTKLWTKQLGTSGTDVGTGVSVDSSDNIYITGSTGGDLDGNTNSGGEYDLFLVKYNSSGTKQWTKQLGTSGTDVANGVSVDSSDNIYITGSTGGDLDGNTNSGSRDIVLVKYNSSGTKQWTKQLGTSVSDFGNGVIVDSSDNIYVTGLTGAGLDNNTYYGGTSDLFLVKYNSSGTKQWTKQLGTLEGDIATGLSVDSSDNIYVTGYTHSGFDGNTNSGGYDIFLIKYNSDGVKQ
jgi:hypothetical protein